jgi:hypothetical protein
MTPSKFLQHRWVYEFMYTVLFHCRGKRYVIMSIFGLNLLPISLQLAYSCLVADLHIELK